MSSKISDNIKEHLLGATRIYFVAIENFQYSHYFSSGKNKSEEDYIANSSHLKFISHSLWRISVIETSKLVTDSRNQEFNLHKLIRKVKQSRHVFKDKDFLIAKWEYDIGLIDLEIKTIKDLRDQIYAHTDKVYKQNFRIDFGDLQRVLGNCWRILFDLHYYLLESTYDSTLPYFEGKELDILKVLSIERDKRLNQLYNDGNK
ncbi:AbiU2 domain-containing protein [Flagellimonas marina]|uniref:HEPN AbiU2-like domain-containing protein n=2 Tax=Flavobacteriaceae TaxID=49546 RepID=A0ABV8PK21_9FLAO